MTADRFPGWSRAADLELVNVSRCRACGARIVWARSGSGRHLALDRDGSRHDLGCADPARLARARAQNPALGWPRE